MVVNFIQSETDYRYYLYNNIYFEKVLDYNLISEKILKNDLYSITPSEKVVSFYMLNKLIKIISLNCEHLLYVIKKKDKDTIENIMNLINYLTHSKNNTFNLYITSFTEDEITNIKEIEKIENLKKYLLIKDEL